MSICCECCLWSGRGLCFELITRPDESYRLCCVIESDLETSKTRWPWPALGRSTTERKKITKFLRVSLKLHTMSLVCKELRYIIKYIIRGVFSFIEAYIRLSYIKNSHRMTLGVISRAGKLLSVWDGLQMESTLNRITCRYNDVSDEACFWNYSLYLIDTSHM